jgi:hypothetical protein
MKPISNIRHIALLILFPVLFELPMAIYFGGITIGDAEMIQKLAFVRHLQAGLPLAWTQLVDCGTVFFGSTNASLSPWDLLIFVMSPVWVSTISFTSYLVLGGLGFYYWRVQKCGTAPFAALFGALVYEGNSYALINTSIGHETLMQQYGWFPFALWLIDELADGRWRRFILGFPWIIFLMALSTYPLMTWILNSILCLRLIWAAGFQRKQWGWLMRGLVLQGMASGLGLALFAFFFVPAAHFAGQTVSPGHPDFNEPNYRYHITLPITHLITLLNPYFYGDGLRGTFWSNFLAHTRIGGFHEYVIYCGLAPLAIVWRYRQSLWNEREGRFWLLCLVLYTWICLGKWGGLYPLLAKLPVLNHFRGPARYTVIWPIALSILTCLALDRLQRNRESLEPCVRITLRFVAIALALALLAWAGMSILFAHLTLPPQVAPATASRIMDIITRQMLPASLTNLLVSFGVAFGTGAIGWWWWRHREENARALIVLLLFDLAITAWIFCWQPSGNREAYEEVDPVANWLGEHARRTGERVMDIDYTLPALRSLEDRFQQIDGYKPLHLPWYQEFINQLNKAPIRVYDTYDYRAKNPNSPLTRFLRVRYVVSHKPVEIREAHQAAAFGRTFIYEDRGGTWPLFYRSPVWQYVTDKGARLASLENAASQNRVPMLLEEKSRLCTEGPPPPLDRNTRLESTWDGGLVYRVSLNADRPCLLGSSITWYDEWRAVDQDGRPLKVLRVNHAFLGAEIPAGTREVRFFFEGRYHRMGIWLSLAALGGYLMIAFVFRKPQQTVDAKRT